MNTALAAQTSAREGILDPQAVRSALHAGLSGRFRGAKLLILIPDHTRTLPLAMLFRMMVEALGDARQIDFMVALGTHPPLPEEALNRLVGISAEERAGMFRHIGLLNHAWDDPDALTQIGTITRQQVQQIAGDLWHPSLGGDVAVRLNRLALDYDHLIILGPTFPHEVVGFSGGAKYLFPGISGAEMINVTHWLGALATILNTIGVKRTPVREMVHAAAALVPPPITLVGLVIVSHGEVKDGVAGIFIGDHLSAWEAAADLSSQRHILWVDQPYQRVLSWSPAMYDELWTGAKAMYKLEPAIADGGEVIVYAPHLEVVSHVHGKYIYEAGYHVRDFYLKQWDKYGHLPLGVLAHGTHLRGSGTYDEGIERARIRVTLSSRISREDCDRLALGYLDPNAVNPAEWQGREAEGILFVPKAGEMLYRLKTKA
ncbi:MAG: lactate racemase domain-containing protein [Anaerolineae bacterium]|nr:lactate racemase domain-containing protein [Anaerolineae bacterium]